MSQSMSRSNDSSDVYGVLRSTDIAELLDRGRNRGKKLPIILLNILDILNSLRLQLV